MCLSHLDSMMTVFADRQEITHDEGHQVGTHLHSLIKLILIKTSWERQRPQLRQMRQDRRDRPQTRHLNYQVFACNLSHNDFFLRLIPKTVKFWLIISLRKELWTVCCVSVTLGMLEMAKYWLSLRIWIENLALNAGSSKQGKAALALVGSNWVEARTLLT